MTGAEFSFELDLTSTCVECGADRPIEGERIMSSKGLQRDVYLVQGKAPCACGENRVKVVFRHGLGDRDE